MRPLTRGYMQSFETRASPQALWRALTEPDELKRWLAVEALVEPRVGGRYCITSRLVGRREAHIERFDPGVRLQLLFDANPAWPKLDDGALLEDFIIDHKRGRRVLRLMGSGIPDDAEWAPVMKRVRGAWAICFSQLQRQLEAEAADETGS